MEKIVVKLTVLFEEPFWVGIYEKESEGTYEVCKITFGAEPKDTEVYEYLSRNWGQLRFSLSEKETVRTEKRIHPKRMQRMVNRELQREGIGTKAQQALKLQQEQRKTAGREKSRLEHEEELQRKYELRKQKKKEKHRGH